MWKAINLFTIFAWLLQISTLVYGAKSAHFTKLKSKFPNGLLSDDYGVLSINDLALNASRLKPPPFIPGATHAFEYWICFENENTLPSCDDEGVDETEGHIGRVNVEACNQEMIYQIFEPRPWPIRSCRNFVKDLKKTMMGTSHACISASSISKEKRNEAGLPERVGILHRFKTRKGCEGQECELPDSVTSKN